ncbi:hypothetical protein AK88_04725, partial [Plasmodium fragile]
AAKPAATQPDTSDTAVGRSQTPASPVSPPDAPPPPPPASITPQAEPAPEPAAASNAGSTGTSSETTPSTGTDTTVTGTGAGTGATVTNPSSGADAVVDGGNDDPPPLNPPKPKPNPNPDQSGSSGSFSDADLADGVSGGEGKGGGAEVGGGEGKGGGGGEQAAGGTGSGSAGGGGRSGTGVGAGTGGSSGGGAGGGAGGSGTEVGTPSLSPGLTWEDVKPYTPALIPAVVGIGIIAFFLWKYFAYLAKRRRTYRTVRDVPSPPLDDDILEHLQRGEPPPDYGYTMVRDTQPGRLPARLLRSPRVNRRTIIELHLEVLNECAAAAWENVKDDYLHILVAEFARDLARDPIMCSRILDAPTTNEGLSGINVSSTVDPTTDSDETDACPPHDPDAWTCMETTQLATDPCRPNEEDSDPWSCMATIPLATGPCAPNDCDPWRCMENIPFEMGPCPPHDCDPWSCMQTIQLEQQQTPAPRAYSSDPGNECTIRDHTHWINWIDRNKHLLQDWTTQPWFLQLKAEWKQYLLAHMVANQDNGVYGQRELGAAATLPMKKLRLWKQWVAQQYRQMSMYGHDAWFQHLLNTVEEQTVPAKGEVPIAEKGIEVDKVMAAEDVLRVRAAPRKQLHPQPYMKKQLTAQIWILILALVIEQCAIESSMQEKELYVDDLLDKL